MKKLSERFISIFAAVVIGTVASKVINKYTR